MGGGAIAFSYYTESTTTSKFHRPFCLNIVEKMPVFHLLVFCITFTLTT